MDSKDILFKIRNKNHYAFKQVFDEHYINLVVYANKYLFDYGLSEDIVQEVFLCLWEKSHLIKIKTSIKAYLYAMVRNKCLNELKMVKITYTDENFIFDNLTKEIHTPFALEDDHKQILHDKTIDLIESLPDKMKHIVKLRFINNYAYKDIAMELNVSINTVKTQLKRAKSRLMLFILFILLCFS
ncbi:RNA polymerase sigma factor [Algibacter pacificus]|uniref:RNA polymerase sigma factor n=1 Tax=Algibacter pacificus TaxID=2599389 RepID=UPI0011C9005B|nr:sigma-70 family RNA polymerase sigma factor [Algibacter pacificus]